MKLRVLTWNVWGVPLVSSHLEARMRALPDAIAALEPDLILLQELWQKEHGALVARALERHGYRFAHHFATTPSGQTGLFIASKLPVSREVYRPFALGRLPHSFWHLDWLVSKGVASWVVETPVGGVMVQDTHFQAQYVTDLYAAERLAQASELVLLNRAELQRPLIVAGDFNSSAGDLVRTTVRELGGFADAAQSADTDTVYARGGGAVTIRVRGARPVLSEPFVIAGGVRTPLSDHAGLLVDLELAAGSPAGPPAPPNAGAGAAAASALLVAAELTRGRVVRAVAVAISLLGIGLLLWRRRPRVALRIAGLALVAIGLVWSGYLAAVYYPRYGASLRAVAHQLSPSR